MTYYIKDVDDKTSDLDLDYDLDAYGYVDHVFVDEDDPDDAVISASLERESDFFKSYTDRGINPWEPATE